jgi:uncharacterized RDD family membrane protein YckC
MIARARGPAAVGEGAGPGVPDTVDPVPPDPARDGPYVGLVTRAIALVLDALLIDAVAVTVTGAVLLMFSVFAISGRHHALAVVIGGVVYVCWVIGYFGVFWTTTGQTPGNRVMQIRVIRTDGTRLRPRHALVRLAGMVISLPLFWGYWSILTTARRRGAFDVMAGTVVVAAGSPVDAGVIEAGSSR